MTIRKETTREVKTVAKIGPIGGENDTPKKVSKKTIQGVDREILEIQRTNSQPVSLERKLLRKLIPKVDSKSIQV